MKYLLFFLPILAFTSEVDPHWLKLLRYKKSFLSYHSQVQNKEFFLSENGAKNPLLEWDKNLELFNSKDPMSFICRFPARYQFFKKKGLVQDFDLGRCEDFNVFRKRLEIKKVSLVFSSYYIDRPASAFGHTFIKLDTADSLAKGSLVSYGVDYAAQVTTNNPLLYGIFGITGGFDGKFSLLPYFFKVREYNDYESRDLFEYELIMSDEEKAFLVAHLYEMNTAKFDYYYFTQNCSYHILALLEAAMNEDLTHKLKFFIVPIDTVKPLLKSGRVSSVNRRLSQREKYLARFSYLEESSKKRVYQVYNQKKLEGITLQTSELDALMDYIDFKHSGDVLLEKESDIARLKEEVLVLRSKKHEASLAIANNQEGERPDQGHGSSQFKLNFGREFEQKTNFAHVRYKFSLHEYLDAPKGFNHNSSLNMGDFAFRVYEKESSVKLMDTTIAEVLSIRNFELQEKNLSWHFSFGAKRIDKFSPYLEVGLGLAQEYKHGFTALILTSRNSYHSSNIKRGFRVDLGPEVITHWRFHSRISWSPSIFLFKNLTNDKEVDYIHKQSILINSSHSFQWGLDFVQSESKKELSLLGKTYF
jgi:hypothetical protein